MGFWKRLLSLDERRRRLLPKIPEGPLRDYYEIPFPDPYSDWRRVNYLPIDLETTGLSPETEEILSIGFTTIRGQSLRLAESAHYLTRPTRDIPEATAVIHGILDDEALGAETLATVMPRVLRALAGKVMVAHYGVIETRFLSTACERLYGFPLIVPIVDTLELEARQIRKAGQLAGRGDLRLAAVRGRYNLPRYPAHNALTDAIAAGELFLAQAARRAAGKHTALRQFLKS